MYKVIIQKFANMGRCNINAIYLQKNKQLKHHSCYYMFLFKKWLGRILKHL